MESSPRLRNDRFCLVFLLQHISDLKVVLEVDLADQAGWSAERRLIQATKLKSAKTYEASIVVISSYRCATKAFLSNEQPETVSAFMAGEKGLILTVSVRFISPERPFHIWLNPRAHGDRSARQKKQHVPSLVQVEEDYEPT